MLTRHNDYGNQTSKLNLTRNRCNVENDNVDNLFVDNALVCQASMQEMIIVVEGDSWTIVTSTTIKSMTKAFKVGEQLALIWSI